MSDYGVPEELKERVEKGMGCFSAIGLGWFDLVRKLDADIAKIYPEYTIDQVKEKFGTLRFYIGMVPEDKYKEIYELIHEAETKSAKICDICGDAGRGISLKGWYVTRCEIHE